MEIRSTLAKAILSVLFVLPFVVYSQNSIEQQDDIWSLDFKPTLWLNERNSPIANKISYSIGLNYHYEINLSKSRKTAIAFGLGYSFSSLGHRGAFKNDMTSNTIWLPSDSLINFESSRLNLNTINFPIEFRIKLKNQLKIYLGYQNNFIFSYASRLKMDGSESLSRQLNTLQIYQHGPRLRVGYKDVFLLGNFYVSSLFKNRTQTPMQLFEFGISFGG